MLKKCKNCWIKSTQVCLLGDSLINMSDDRLNSILFSCGITKPIHIKKEFGNGFAHLHFDNVKDSTTFYYVYHIKRQCICLQLPSVIAKPALTNKTPVIYDFSLIDTAPMNNGSGFCICHNANNTANIVNETENHQSVTYATSTVNESGNTQPVTNAISTLNESENHQSVTNATNTENESENHQPVTNATNTVNESENHQPVTNATSTVNESGNTQPVTNATNTVNESENHQPVTNATNTVNESENQQPVTNATNTENESGNTQPVTNATNTVNESENHQPITNVTSTVNEFENHQPVNNTTSTVKGRKRRVSELWEDDLKSSIIKLRRLIEKREQTIYNEQI